MSDDMPGRMSERMSEDMPERMSEDMRTRKSGKCQRYGRNNAEVMFQCMQIELDMSWWGLLEVK